MHKFVSLITLILLSIPAFSQANLWSKTNGRFINWEDYQVQNGYYQEEEIRENNIKSRVQTTHHKRNSHQRTFHFDERGRVISSDWKSKKRKSHVDYTYDERGNLIHTETQYTKGNYIMDRIYDAKNQMIKQVYTNPKNEKYITSWKYNTAGDILEKEEYKYNGKYQGTVYQYDASGNMTSHKIYTKDKSTPTYILDYTYWENGSRKTTTYTEKGKVKYVWTFDCKAEGELLGVKKKDESTICILEEEDADGNKVIWNREFNEKGELIKSRTVKDKESGKVISKQLFNKSDQIYFESFTKENGDRARISYDKHGEIHSQEEWQYNEDKQLVKHFRTGKGWTFRYIYSYEGNLKTAQVRVYKRSTYIDEIDYTFY